jgi:chemotaxis protein methyltransferase WspC
LSTAKIAQLLADRLGHDVDALGELIFEQVLAQARLDLNVADNGALLRKLEQSESAFCKLTELLVIPETWFFRMQEQFDDLLRFAHGNSQRPIRVLSLPCSTGEEVYSILMALSDAGFSEDDVEVTGWDISECAVRFAKRGQYSVRALRGQAPHPRWMQPLAEDRLQMHASLCARARFEVRNARFLAPLNEPRFDVIFCRNLLIYLKPDARTALLSDLRGMLAPQGLLLAGLAEFIPAMAPGFKHWPQGTALSFTQSDVVKPAAQNSATAFAELQATRADFAKSIPVTLAVSLVKKTAPIIAKTSAESSQGKLKTSALEQAQILANSGDLAGAQLAIAQALNADPNAGEAHFLAGILALASNDLVAADTAFLRTQYLQPDHLAALEHRAAIAKRLSRSDAAELDQRALRLRQRLGVNR